MSEGLVHRLRQLAEQAQGDKHFTLGDVADAHGDKAQGALLVLLAAPCLLPLPGAGSIMSVGLTALALLMWRGVTELCLPDKVAQLRLPATSARRLLGTLAWCYAWAERLARERWVALTSTVHQRWMAGVVACMAVLIFLPIPLGNVLPALSLMLLGMGLVFRDGVAVSLALGVATLAVGSVGAFFVWTWHLGWQLL